VPSGGGAVQTRRCA